MKLASCLTLGLALSILSSAGEAADWGDITGTFVYDGTPPKPAPAKVDKDKAVCGALGLVDESVLVGKGGGLKNVVVYMYLRRGAKAPAAHPDVKPQELELDNKGCRFEPHVLCMTTSDTLTLANADPIGHSTKIDFFVNKPQNPALPAGGKLSLKGQITSAESLPSPVSCGIHPWMKSWILVQDHPFFAVSDENGKFTIKNVPAGKHTFRFWQEKAGYVRGVSVGSAKTDPRRGTIELTVKKGANDLGEIKVPASLFK
jgi:hypothetical protein